MNVKFIDTSVMLNLLEVPNMCSDSDKVKMQWKRNLESNDVLIMPSATIIETGNHIAHISNGNKRREIAKRFGEFLRKTANGEAPWELYGVRNTKEELIYLAPHFDANSQTITYKDPYKNANTTITTYTGDWETTYKNVRKSDTFELSFISTDRRR